MKKSFNTSNETNRKAQILVGVLDRDNFSDLINYLIEIKYDEAMEKFINNKNNPIQAVQ